jgi:hypothetical protein
MTMKPQKWYHSFFVRHLTLPIGPQHFEEASIRFPVAQSYDWGYVFQQSLNNQYFFGSLQQNSSCNKSSNFSQRTVLHWCCQLWEKPSVSQLHPLRSMCMARLPMKGSSLLHALEQLFYAWWQTQCQGGAQHFPDCHSCDRTHHQCSNA